jgi:hypothetical protein
MSITPQSFLVLAHKQFDYLRHEFEFTASDRIGEGWVKSAFVLYDSPKLTITPSWNSRDGVAVGIGAKQDTFWIRPASPHGFDIQELVQIAVPEALREPPPVEWPDENETEIDAWLGFYAAQLRAHATPLLRGDLSICEDMLIMRYCNSVKGLPAEDYFRVFREATATFPAEDRQLLEAAIASGSRRQVGFLLQEWVHKGRLRGERLLTTLNDFWLQYFQ